MIDLEYKDNAFHNECMGPECCSIINGTVWDGSNNICVKDTYYKNNPTANITEDFYAASAKNKFINAQGLYELLRELNIINEEWTTTYKNYLKLVNEGMDENVEPINWNSEDDEKINLFYIR